jgi:hypothetical protein
MRGFDCRAVAPQKRRGIALDVQAIFRRRRHQPRTPTLAKISPHSPDSVVNFGAAFAIQI